MIFEREISNLACVTGTGDGSEVECGICSDLVALENGCFCTGSPALTEANTKGSSSSSSSSSTSTVGGDEESHFACRESWWQYLTKSDAALKESTTSVRCISFSTCPRGLLATPDVLRCLGPLDRLVAREKEAERSQRVALAGRRIFCTSCRAVVGVVAAEDRGGGPVACPHCQRPYCAECGNVSLFLTP